MPYPLRMSEQLRERLTEQAKQHNRSLHAEIIGILESSTGSAPAVVPDIDVDALAEALAPKLVAKLRESPP